MVVDDFIGFLQQDDEAVVPIEEINLDTESENYPEEHGTSLCFGNDSAAIDTIGHPSQSTQSEIANSSDLAESPSTGSDLSELAIQDVICSGDFGKIVQLKSQVHLQINKNTFC